MLIDQILLNQSLHRIPSGVEFGRIGRDRERVITVWLRRFNQLCFRHALRCILVESPQS